MLFNNFTKYKTASKEEEKKEMDPAAVDLFSPDKPEDIKMAEDEAEQIETKERQEFKEKVISILSMNSYEDKRAAKIDIMGFLDLLRLFNEGGIHFK